MKQLLLTLFLLVGISTTNLLTAQCFESTPLEERLHKSELVVSATVTSSTPFYNHLGRIMTRHELDIHEIFRGNTNLEVAEVITHGGQINEELSVVNPALQLQSGQSGLFLLRPYAHENGKFRPVAVSESLLARNPLTGNFSDRGDSFTGNDLAQMIENFYGQAPTVKKAMLTATDRPASGRNAMVVINNFSPTTASAGTGTILTIDGSGFGAAQGTVFFDNPDDGSGGSFGAALPGDVVSWNDNQIQVAIPGQAGTGAIIVQAANGMNGTSASNLTITFAVTTLGTASGSVNSRMIDDMHDDDGGYRYVYSSSTANAGVSFAADADARAAFERALGTWQQDPGAEYAGYAGANCGTTTIQQPLNDGVNVISYDNNAYDFDDELSDATIGVAFSDYSACGSSEFELVNVDIFFRRNGDPNNTGGSVNWYYGIGSQNFNQSSFESTALHELGHAHQLSHVNNPMELMHFSSNTGSNVINISTGASTGAAFVKNLSLAYNPPIINCNPANDFPFARQYTTYDVAEDCGAVAAPVSYLSFDGFRKEGVVELEWRTAFELNNEAFIIQRSVDGRTFNDIGRVVGNGNSRGELSYGFLDTRPLSSISYYRLAQRDFDGTINLSRVVRVAGKVAGLDELILGPNPFNEQLTISGIGTGVEEIILFDVSGREVLRRGVSRTSGTATLLTNQIPQGVYWLKIGEESRKVVKR
ncbi:hypothetical protein CEQ90_12730 [Lewinellaceae bacterium SD302]|nr:hypothetical protein CEQ90_12730 [Lewinellaceae bacterium SD302]